MGFVNLSNHPSERWSEDQLAAARTLATPVIDVPFPIVPAGADLAEVEALVDAVLGAIDQLDAPVSAAMVGGELTATMLLVGRLQARGVRCVAATTARDVVDEPDGTRRSRFRFVRFRAYPSLSLDG